LGLAVNWFTDGLVSEAQRDEITSVVSVARFPEWRPLVYVIPYDRVAKRVREAPRDKRASFEPEYIIPDLVRDEFDILEPIV
jgi:hypothetical protein